MLLFIFISLEVKNSILIKYLMKLMHQKNRRSKNYNIKSKLHKTIRNFRCIDHKSIEKLNQGHQTIIKTINVTLM